MRLQNTRKGNLTLALYAAIFGICLLLFVGGMIPRVAAAEDFYIDRTYLTAGMTLPVQNPNGYTLRYFVDGTEIEPEAPVLTPELYEHWIKVAAYRDEELVAEDSVYFSKLPVLYINTADGEAVTSKNDYKDAAMTIQNNAPCSEAMYSGSISVKGRGNSSWSWPKKPYKLKLDKKTDLFGMGKNKHWVLLANYLDESLLRNTTATHISETLGLETMHTVWTDVVLNGEYVGNYQLCEHIRIGDTRVNIFDWESEADELAAAVYKKDKKTIVKSELEDFLEQDLSWVTTGEFTFNDVTYQVADYYDAQSNLSGGYLFELSNEYDELSKFTTNRGLKVMVSSPEYLYTNPQMTAQAQMFWNTFEAAYCAEDGYADGVHYTDMADLDTMVSYWLVMEIMGNGDAYYKSRFAYLDLDGKLQFGPAWDFDWAAGSSQVSTNPNIWKLSQVNHAQNFFREFADDPLFICKATERYWQLRPYLDELLRDGGILDTEYLYLAESGLADQQRWDRAETWPTKARGFATDASMLKTFLQNRLAWLDQQFQSDETLLKSLYTSTSASPYKKADDRMQLSVPGGREDCITAHVPADYAIDRASELTVSVQMADETTKTLNVYVNGLFYAALPVSDGTAEAAIDGALLTDALYGKDLISFIGKDASGNTTARNFLTVCKYQPGDTNCDTVINGKDVTMARRHLAGGYGVSVNATTSDANGDGVLNGKDVTQLRRYLAGGYNVVLGKTEAE